MIHLPITLHFAALTLVFHTGGGGGRKNDITTHEGKHHKEAASAASFSKSMTSFFIRPQLRQNVTEDEARWALFTAKHNLSFLSSDHATKLFN